MTEFPVFVFLLIIPLAVAVAAADDGDELDPERINAIAQMLPADPEGLGRPVGDRDAWQELAELDAYQSVIERAWRLAETPIPDQPDELFLDFSRTGNRSRWQRVAGRRRGRITPFVLAECVQNEGTFLGPLEQIVDALCEEPTWVMPAHDRGLENFRGETIDIDLASSALAWNLATANYLLGDRLSDDCRDTIAENVSKRALKPYRDMYTGQRRHNWWMHTTNNWNAVCLAGVTGAAMAQIEDARTRAEYVAAAEKYSRNFLRGFTDDGYCSEGLGYWNYGFGHYVLLSETIYQATDGGVDLLGRPEARMPARFPFRIQIMSGIAPAFADCSVGTQPSQDTMYYLNKRFGFGLEEYDELNLRRVLGGLSTAMIYSFPNSLPQQPPEAGEAETVGIRTWFEDAGILIGRPSAGSDCKLGIAAKGGHNAEHHNHNDVGSYVVVYEDRDVLLDPGKEVYTARTFSGRRYESKLLNSYGHPVPVVAGELQRTGRGAKGEVLQAEFTPQRDVFKLDMQSAYDVAELQQLHRTFEYSREGAGALTVTDTVEFSEPKSFESALITRGGWKRLDDGSIAIYDVDRALRATIETTGADFELAADEIHEDAPVQPTRIAIRLTEPVEAATVAARIEPMPEFAEGARSGLLLNGDFEYGTWGWSIGAGMGSVSDERASSGEYSLKITDDTDGEGSSITSAPIAVQGAGAFTISGKVFHVSGEGIGIYIRMYDSEGNMLNERDERGWISAVGGLSGPQGDWAPFEFGFETPPETDNLRVWIHSYSSAQVEAYIDELQVKGAEH